MRRALTPILLGLALGGLTAAPASAASLRELVGSGSTVSLQNGRGFATVNSNAGSGSSFGKVGNGRITIVDAPRGAETKVTVRNCDQIRRPNRRTTVCIGDGIGFSLVNGIWKVTLKGRGINASAVATGSLRLKGTRGRFSIDYGDYRSWPRVARTYRLG